MEEIRKINNINLKGLLKELKQSYTYVDRLKLFDKYFNIIPFKLPLFQPDFDLLFEGENGNLLLDIFEIERSKKKIPRESMYIKKITCYGKNYIFNISPNNSLRELYNDFIVNKIINEDSNYIEKINFLKSNSVESREKLYPILNKEFDQCIKLQNHKLEAYQKPSFKNQFLNVYSRGYDDYNQGLIRSFPNKKKIIELYLYAQGVLKAKYYYEVKKCFPNLNFTY